MANKGIIHLDNMYEYMGIIHAVIQEVVEALEELRLSIYMIEWYVTSLKYYYFICDASYHVVDHLSHSVLA